MTISEDTIKNAVLRYHREYDKEDGRFTRDRDSSDLLLVLLLPKVANYFVLSSGEAVSDGVGLVRWFSAHFQGLSKVESEGLN